MSNDQARVKRETIYDAFMFHNEVDVLRLRLNELYPVVDRFVIVEATITFSGRPKELVFPKHQQMFREFDDKVIYKPIYATEMILSRHASAWQRERAQRDSIHPFILSQGASAHDVVIVSDVDEIPRASVIESYRIVDGLRKLDMSSYYYYFNLQTRPSGWRRSFVVPVGQIPASLTEIRGMRAPVIANAGWHFSYIGGVDQIRNKFQSFSHTEYDKPEFLDHSYIERCLSKRVSLFRPRGAAFQVVPVSDNLPEYVIHHQRDLQHLLTADTE